MDDSLAVNTLEAHDPRPARALRPAIVIPVFRPRPTPFEEISLTQCSRVLAHYPMFLVSPGKLDPRPYRDILPAVPLHFYAEYFRSLEGYNRLMLSPAFYNRFVEFDFVLIHQPDVFVFADDLLHWCERGYSYVGAPWREGLHRATAESPLIGVGNGGFSLRRVRDCLRITKLHRNPFFWLRTAFQSIVGDARTSRYRRRLLRQTTPTWRRLAQRPTAEDLVFGSSASYADRAFSVPDPLTALHFAIETQPRASMRLLGNDLPFGAHAWWKYDLEFWRPNIEGYGYALTKLFQNAN
jgi:hypothetical protein